MASKELDIGRAGEYITMADLIIRGQKVFLTDQGVNYDLVVDMGDRLLRGQVKTTQKMRRIHPTSRPVYFYHIRRAGRGGKRKYNYDEFDFFALVALDRKEVFYLPFDKNIGVSSICIRDKEIKYTGVGSGGRKNGIYFQDLTWDALCQKL